MENLNNNDANAVNECYICSIEFSASAPQPAILDAPLVGGGGIWAYFCRSHLGNAKRGVGWRLDRNERDKKGG